MLSKMSLRRFARLSLWPARAVYNRIYRQRGLRGSFLRNSCCVFALLISSIIVLLIFTASFRPSYTNPPKHYQALQKRCVESEEPGRGNINREKIFISATLSDPGGTLVRKDWGNAVLELVDLLGPENVHLSIYENDADPLAKAALDDMGKKFSCNSSLVSEHLPLDEVPRVTTPSGESRMKRVALLAEVRNRALRPLETAPQTQFDELLSINDVIFNPMDALNLLFSTNYQPPGYTEYRAACAVDFINAFKFYDRFATRDFEGYPTGIPFYPWFTNAGRARSRREVLAQKDAVRVRACGGGMTAFEAKWFQKRHPGSSSSHLFNSSDHIDFCISPLCFRYKEDPFWEASECYLIHADLTYLHQGANTATDPGIFMNPYVRVAYDSYTLGWLPYTRRIERLYPLVQNILNHVVGMPEYNPRRLEEPGDKVLEKVWRYDEGGEQVEVSQMDSQKSSDLKGPYHEMKRIADPGRFCGTRRLLVLRENPEKGEKNWETVPLPPVP